MIQLTDPEHSNPTNIKVTSPWSTEGRWYGLKGRELVLVYERDETGFIWSRPELLSDALKMQVFVVPQ
jgi:hypothetical protein